MAATLPRALLACSSVSLMAQARGQDPNQLQERVNAAIARGVQYLLARQEIDGSWSHAIGEYRNGQTSLSLYALLKSKVPASHPSVRRALEFLRCEPADKTYAAGLEALAIDALGSEADDDRVASIGEALVQWQNGGFAYPSGEPDISNSQYGALGLLAASKHGAEIPAKAWQNLATFALAQQEKWTRPDDPAGFVYHAGFPVTGSRTVGGLTVLAVCEQFLADSDPLRKACAGARQRGLAWLARNFSATTDPLAGSDEWRYYWLYGCERVGALTRQAKFGEHDWYREGAAFLVDDQKADGEWSNQPNTCFALLFLERATAPSSGAGAARAARTYGSDHPGKDVSMRASGDTPLNVWVSRFGDRALRDYAWPGDAENSLRVERVDFLLPDQPLLADARTGSVEWRSAPKPPANGWTGPEFDDSSWRAARGGFGPSASADARVESEWNDSNLWLRTKFQARAADCIEPRLVLRWVGAALDRRVEAASPPLVALFDENARFHEDLHFADAGSTVELSNDAFHGSVALTVSPLQRHRDVIPGWSFEIAKKPGPTQYRYLQFAWRKSDGDGVMLQVARNGRWEGTVCRYFAGRTTVDWPAEEIDDARPDRWTVVTRDLYEDLGEGAKLTGMAFTSLGAGKASFDAIYLARSKSDFAAIDKRGIELERERLAARENGAARERGAESLSVWLNGRLALESTGIDYDWESVEADADLRELMRDGANVIAVHAHTAGGARSFDLGLRDARPLVSIPGTPSQASTASRFAARISLPRAGEFELQARVRIAVPPGADGKSALADLFSDPLKVTIREAADPTLLAYASDPTRNLLRATEITARCSSELPGWPAMRASDGLLALGWLCNDGDADPWIQLSLARAARANTLVFTHPQLARADATRTGRVRSLAVRFNGQDPPHRVELDRDDARKTVWTAPSSLVVKSIEVRVLERSGVSGAKDGVGLAEIELRLVR